MDSRITSTTLWLQIRQSKKDPFHKRVKLYLGVMVKVSALANEWPVGVDKRMQIITGKVVSCAISLHFTSIKISNKGPQVP